MSRRNTIAAAGEPCNRTHSTARPPRPAVHPPAVMFATEDVCCISQEALKTHRFGKALRRVLRAMVEAGFVSRQVGASRIPDTYRLQAPMIGEVP
jgi:hypothetical protein